MMLKASIAITEVENLAVDELAKGVLAHAEGGGEWLHLLSCNCIACVTRRRERAAMVLNRINKGVTVARSKDAMVGSSLPNLGNLAGLILARQLRAWQTKLLCLTIRRGSTCCTMTPHPDVVAPSLPIRGHVCVELQHHGSGGVGTRRDHAFLFTGLSYK